MPRSVTVIFGDGHAEVYTDVPDNITPDQVEAQARQDNPGRQIREIVGGDVLLERELRDAIDSRNATMEDLVAIARARNAVIPDDARASLQAWIDYAGDNPNVSIPDDIFVAPISRTEAFTLGGAQGAGGVFGTLLGGMRNTPMGTSMPIISALSELPYERILNTLTRSPQYQRAQTQRPAYLTAGQITGEVAASAPLAAIGGGALAEAGTALRGLQSANIFARGARAAAPVIENIGRATATGGTGVRAATPEAIAAGAPIATTTARRVGLRATGGALNAALTNLMANRDVTAADLATGAAVPIIGTIARRGFGAVYDALVGRVGETQAAQILRTLISTKSSQIADALRTATADARANTAEFLASRGLLTPELAEATRVAVAGPEGRQLAEMASNRAFGQQEMLNVVRGGETDTEAVANALGMRQAVRNQTEPLRETALEAADVGRTQIIPLENAAARDAALANEITNSGFVRRMRGLEERASEQARIMGDYPEFFPDMERIQQTRGIAGAAGGRAERATNAQIALRDSAAEARRAAENLRNQGLSPLDISGVVGRLRQAARTAQFVNTPRERVLNTFADNLENRARMMGGVIDAEGLYELRKGMNDQIADLLQGTDPSSLQSRTAEIVGEIKPLIDDAIEAAGGSVWRNYLDRFSEGMTRVERQVFGRRLAALPRARFERVMSGRDPDFVTKFFGSGRYDINAEVLPEALPSAQRLAGEIDVDRQIARLGRPELPAEMASPVLAGERSRVAEILAPPIGPVARSVFNVVGRIPGISGGGNAVEQMTNAYSKYLARNAMRSLAPALADPAEALRLLPMQTTSERMANAFSRLPPAGRNFAMQAIPQLPEIVAPTTGENAAPSPMSIAPDQVFLGFQIGPDGREYPVYGPAGGR